MSCWLQRKEKQGKKEVKEEAVTNINKNFCHPRKKEKDPYSLEHGAVQNDSYVLISKRDFILHA